ncbi:MAG: hypothetical protein IJJ41_00380, partial [Clostridia bacterium]|nr:hypothetical protein [Clostridia bacterium]
RMHKTLSTLLQSSFCINATNQKNPKNQNAFLCLTQKLSVLGIAAIHTQNILLILQSPPCSKVLINTKFNFN